MAVRSSLITMRYPPQFHLLGKIPVSFTEKETDREALLGLELDPAQAKSRRWVLLALSFVMLLVVLLLAYRLYILEKSSLVQDTSARDTSTQDTRALKSPPKACFLGIAMEPHQVVRKQWLLLGLCLILMLCSIGLTIRIFTQHNRKPPGMRAEWWSWD